MSSHEPAVGALLTSATVDGSSNDLQPPVLARHLAGHVLLVDDVHDDSLLLADLLTPLETNVMVARSTAEALAVLDKQVVDLVVTDLNMPGASGLDLTREVRKRHDIPAVIFLTGSVPLKTSSKHWNSGQPPTCKSRSTSSTSSGSRGKFSFRVGRNRRASGSTVNWA